MRGRLVLVAAATTAMVVIAFVIPLGLLVRTLAAERALTSARQVAGALAPVIATGDDDDVRVALEITRFDAPGPVTVVMADGTAIGEVSVDADEVLRAREGEAYTVPVEGGRDVVTPVFAAGRTAVVHVRVPTATLTAGVWQAWAVLAGLGVALVAAAVVVADRLGRSVVGPADAVAGAARRLATGDRGARAPVEGPPEIADVAVALNGLADRIDELRAAEREAAADLSHRLRTPLTALRLDVEALPPGPDADRLAADLRALDDTVDRVIRQARAGTAAGRGPTDVARLVRDRVAFWAPLVEDEGRRLETRVDTATAWAEVVPDDLAAAVDALLGNVLQHTAPGVALGVDVRDHGARVEVVVHDAGPGLPEGATERGRSGGASTGLGLDICRRLAEDAGGSFHVGTGPWGGAAVTLGLPAASPR